MDAAYTPPDTPLDVIHRDHALLVVNKPAGLLSVPGKGEHLADCLLSRAQGAFPEALLVHRLDRDTSGVIVFALTPAAQRHLGLQFERRHVRKTYVARVWDHVADNTGTVDLPRLRLYPHTGRSHQLRVHMQAIGHPILGDPFYAEGPARDFPRLMLHAESLRLRHPDGGKGMTFSAKCPF
jgi:tRNA pseudouridine32 synthase/23S rRNA pseudouridine746 synthase